MKWIYTWLAIFGPTVILFLGSWMVGVPLRWYRGRDLAGLDHLSEAECQRALSEWRRRARHLQFFCPTVLASLSLSLGCALSMALWEHANLNALLVILLATTLSTPGVYLAGRLQLRQRRALLNKIIKEFRRPI